MLRQLAPCVAVRESLGHTLYVLLLYLFVCLVTFTQCSGIRFDVLLRANELVETR